MLCPFSTEPLNRWLQDASRRSALLVAMMIICCEIALDYNDYRVARWLVDRLDAAPWSYVDGASLDIADNSFIDVQIVDASVLR